MTHTHFPKKTIKDIPLQGKTVLLRADFNVPLYPDGTIAGDYRITQTLPTLHYLLQKNCKIVIISHLGRPAGKPNQKESLKKVAECLAEHLPGVSTQFVPSLLSDSARITCRNMQPGSIVMLENLRFNPREEENSSELAHELQRMIKPDYFVQDGFGVVHRAHMSTEAITHYIPSVAGLLLSREVSALTAVMNTPQRPLTAVIGGAKISDKINFIHRLLAIADTILIGGAMANTFLAYKGLVIGKSRTEEGQTAAVAEILKNAKEDQVILPIDVGVASAISENATRTDVLVSEVQPTDYILDLGPQTTAQFKETLAKSATVIWNGTLGMTELSQFTSSSAAIAAALYSDDDLMSIIGGGDTADFVLDWQQDTDTKGSFTHISTGGGASLELMSGQRLPGVEALID